MATAAWRAEGRVATELVRMARAVAAAVRARPAVGRAARRPTSPAISMPPPGCAFTAAASASLAATTERDARRGAARTTRCASTSARVVGRTRDVSGTTSATTAASPAPSRAPERRRVPRRRRRAHRQFRLVLPTTPASIRSRIDASRRVTPARIRPPCACPDRSMRAARSVCLAAATTRVRAEVAAREANALRRERCAAAR